MPAAVPWEGGVGKDESPEDGCCWCVGKRVDIRLEAWGTLEDVGMSIEGPGRSIAVAVVEALA